MTSDRITFTVRVGISSKSESYPMTMDVEKTSNDLINFIGKSRNVAVKRLTVVFNGKAICRYGVIPPVLQGVNLGDLSIADGSELICIVSGEAAPSGQQTMEQKAVDKVSQEPEQATTLDVVMTCVFEKRPFGFAVWANAQGKNAIVTKVAGANALKLGIQIGYVVYVCNGELVYGKPHDEVLELLKTTPCPLKLRFADLGEEYTCAFTSKPLGFTVIQDREENNAKVSKINTRAAQNLGVLIGSYVVGVNSEKVFGTKHKAIINYINGAQFPINIIFRHPPPLLMLAPRSRRARRKG